MADYVVLMSITQKGASDLFDQSSFVQDLLAVWKEKCGPVTAFRLTFGDVDMVLLGEAQDDEKVAKFALWAAQTGRVKTTTMRAFGLTSLEGFVSEAASYRPRSVAPEG